jgi:hypothetical protein
VLRRSRRRTTLALHHQGDPRHPLPLQLLLGTSHSGEANCASHPPTALRVLGHCPTVPRPSDTSPSRSLAYARRALVATDSLALHTASAGSLPVALHPPHPASGTIGHFRPLRSRHVTLQFDNAPAPLPNQLQFGTISTAARHRQAAAIPPPLPAFPSRLPSIPPPCWTTSGSSLCPSLRRPTS